MSSIMSNPNESTPWNAPINASITASITVWYPLSRHIQPGISVYQCKSSGRNVTQISICTALVKQHLTWVTFSSILKTITSHSKRSKWSTFQLDVGCRCANHRQNSMHWVFSVVGTTASYIQLKRWSFWTFDAWCDWDLSYISPAGLTLIYRNLMTTG